MPASGEASNQYTAHYKHQENYAKAEEDPTAASVRSQLPNGRYPESKEQDGGTHENSVAINVASPASVPVGWNWHEKVLWIANILLALVGGAGIAVALMTLRKMERQTVATEVAAKAAEKSAKTAMGVSIPTLVLDRFNVGPRGFGDVKATLQSPKISIVIRNYGQSPAFLTSYSVVVTCESLPINPEENIINLYAGAVVESGKPFHMDDALGLSYYMRPEDLESVVQGTKDLTVYGYLEYGDIFKSPLRRMKFCKRMMRFGDNPRFDFLDWGDASYRD
ncbi:MAG: hypothetical protein ABI177_04875 [Edaphobacter sp.]